MKDVQNWWTKAVPLKSGLFFSLVVLAATVLKAGYWTLSSSISYNNSYYVYEESVRSYYINAGLRYHSNNWSVSAYLPFIMQSNIFTDGTQNMDGNTTISARNSGTAHSYNADIGDIFLYGEYRFLYPQRVLPALYLTMQVKIPTVPGISLYSTGKFDYGIGLTARQWISGFYGFANINYIKIGDPPGIDYKNPLNFGFGMGKFINNGKYAINLCYKAYTEIVDGYEPPRQLSLGFNFALIPRTIFSLYLK